VKLIEADKVEQAIKDYWKAQVDRAPIPKSTEEYNAYVNCLDAILERNDGLLKVIDEMPPAEPEAMSKWEKEFREYVDSLDIARDDWKGIIEYIDELPSAEPYTTTHDSIPVKKGGNDEDRTSGDCISRQAAIDAVERNSCNTQRAIDAVNALPSAQPERLTDDDFETIRIHLNAYKEKLCNQQRWEEAEEYQRIIDRFMAFASAQPQRMRGKWTYGEDEYGIDGYHCDKCGFFVLWDYTHKFIDFIKDYHFCPNCGADMRYEG